MEHNLDTSLNLVDFEHGEETVVNQEDIALDSSGQDESIPMEFEQIEEQPVLMDTGSEEIIVSDFMGEQFTLQEYSVTDDQVTDVTTTMENNQQNESLLSSHSGMQTMYVAASGELTTSQAEHQTIPKIINIKSSGGARAAVSRRVVAVPVAAAPRQVAIAPKPPRAPQVFSAPFGAKKQLPIAPKPARPPVKSVTLVAGSKPLTMVKKVGVKDPSSNTVLAQLGGGKQLVMVPQKMKVVASGGGPLRLLASSRDSDQAQLIPTQNIPAQNKVMAKVIVQGGSSSELSSNQPAVITKLAGGAGSAGGAGGGPRLVTMHQKTVPISIANNKVIVSSPSKFGKKQIITIKSPTPKLLPAPSTQGTGPKKVIVTANPTQNIVIKSAGKPGQTKAVGQRTQLHQINVPGKGIQYIRLVTSQSAQAQKPAAKAAPGKTFVLTDSQGNLIHMTAEKVHPTAPPPLLVNTRVTSKPQQKLVRIAPITSKASQQPIMQQQQVSRASGQSLLAPLSSPGPAPAPSPPPDLAPSPSPPPEELPPAEPEHTPQEEFTHEDIGDVITEEVVGPVHIKHEPEPDSKAALRALIADAVGADADHYPGPAHAYDPQSPQAEANGSQPTSPGAAPHPVIIIPSEYMKQPDAILPDDDDPISYNMQFEEKQAYNVEYQQEQQPRIEGINVEVEYSQFPDSPDASQALDGELGARGRKACNCTKSQCLKLYCDCFANGEFCHRCNCVNCHNNLDNEELRQKAIRGCLDRNPNAFRPKIGKTKAGGPVIIRRHNKGCNCKRSGCLKNYCECYEAKIACTSICKCVGCRNVEETLERRRRLEPPPRLPALLPLQAPPHAKQPCSFMTSEVIEAVCQCLIAAAVEAGAGAGDGAGEGEGEGAAQAHSEESAEREPLKEVLEEFARCLHDIISASHHSAPPAPPANNKPRDEAQQV